ncbi:MAG: zinc ribbon domain-containing protein [Eubacteriales bacterium]|nr:zinc ribbon domain-containing protein [Eubacteriales bacterium]
MRCPGCGYNNPRNARRCGNCGKRLDRVRERKKEQAILLYGIILILLILAVGFGAMMGMSKVLQSTSGAGNERQKVTIVTTPKPEPTADPEEKVVHEAETGTAETILPDTTPTEVEMNEPIGVTPTPTEAPAATGGASLVDENRKNEMLMEGYFQVTVANSTASSTIDQEYVDNNPYVLYDGADYTSWQEGVDGDGLGSTVDFTFDREYSVKFLVLKLGNWYDTDEYYYRNNRPSKMTFELGGQSFTVDFPDQKTEFVLEFENPISSSNLHMIIDEVYKGTEYEDTCINEIDVYGM